MQEQALETREATSPSHPTTAYVGIEAVAVMVCAVKFAAEILSGLKAARNIRCAKGSQAVISVTRACCSEREQRR